MHARPGCAATRFGKQTLIKPTRVETMTISLTDPYTYDKPAAPNAARALPFQFGRHWRGVGEPDRWATSDAQP